MRDARSREYPCSVRLLWCISHFMGVHCPSSAAVFRSKLSAPVESRGGRSSCPSYPTAAWHRTSFREPPRRALSGGRNCRNQGQFGSSSTRGALGSPCRRWHILPRALCPWQRGWVLQWQCASAPRSPPWGSGAKAPRGICAGLKAAAGDWRAPGCATGHAAPVPTGRETSRCREHGATGAQPASAAIAQQGACLAPLESLLLTEQAKTPILARRWPPCPTSSTPSPQTVLAPAFSSPPRPGKLTGFFPSILETSSFLKPAWAHRAHGS